MFMENDHRDRIKQIYAQTGKILEETLKNPTTDGYVTLDEGQFDLIDPPFVYGGQAIHQSFDKMRRRGSGSNFNNMHPTVNNNNMQPTVNNLNILSFPIEEENTTAILSPKRTGIGALR